ncbi:signal peptidase II [Kocuria coralli]|uniref:signal peptidase II n=1 Tax=Kocuria coralli TaxID=1461025 RepID=UPI0015F2CBA5|nr:signal peptidase II [Kocuria coralli]
MTRAEQADGHPRRGKAVFLVSALATAALIYGLDQGAKIYVERNMQLGETIPVLGDWVQWHYILNPGAAFSLGEDHTWIFTAIMAVVSVGIVIFLPRVRSWAWVVALGLVLGGATGNLTDRLTRWPGFPSGHVVDFIHVKHFAVFNIADCGVVIGIALTALLLLTGREPDGTRTSGAARDTEAAAERTEGAGSAAPASGALPSDAGRDPGDAKPGDGASRNGDSSGDPAPSEPAR